MTTPQRTIRRKRNIYIPGSPRSPGRDRPGSPRGPGRPLGPGGPALPRAPGGPRVPGRPIQTPTVLENHQTSKAKQQW